MQRLTRRHFLRGGLWVGAGAGAVALASPAEAATYANRTMACGQVTALKFATPPTTTITVQSTFYVANVTGATIALVTGAEQFDNPSGHQLRYIGTETRMFHCGCTVTFKAAAGSNQVVGVRIAKNGTTIATSEIRDTCGNSDYESTALHEIIEMATNQYLEVYVTNHSGTNGVDVAGINLFAVSAM